MARDLANPPAVESSRRSTILGVYWTITFPLSRPAPVRALALLDSWWFLAFGLPVLATVLIVVLTVAIGSAGSVIGINLYDVVPSGLEVKLTVVTVLAIIAVVIVASGWATYYDAPRSTRRNSVILRTVVMGLIVSCASVLMLSETGERSGTPFDIFDVAGPPVALPDWREGRSRTSTASCTPPPAFMRIRTEPRLCTARECVAHALVALERGEQLTHASTDLPPGTIVSLEVHERSWLEEQWQTVATATIDASGRVTTPAPRSAWYRVTLTIPDPAIRWWSYCQTTRLP